MTRREPVSARALGQIVLVLLTIALVAILLGHVRAATPTRTLPELFEGVEDPRGAQTEYVTCQRTLPDRLPTTVGRGEVPRPVGLVRSSEVYACPDVFDPSGRGSPPIEYIGEVVGDVLHREHGAWVLVNDDAYALEHGPLPAHREFSGANSGLSVWIPEDVFDPDALRPGRPRLRGDVLLIQGNILRADPADGGGLTLRATAIERLAPAVPARPPLHPRQAAAAAVMGVLAVLVVAYERRVASER